MKKFAVVFCLLLTLGACFALGQDEGFQTARVVSFERVANDAQHPEKADSYKMTMRISDVIYNCKANQPFRVFNDWTTGKEFPAKVVSEKTMQVKNFDGQIIELTILNKKKPK